VTQPLPSAQGPVHGVLFDLDGTLLDTLDDIANAANRVLVAHGFPVHEIDAYRRFVGDGVRSLVDRMLPEEARDGLTVEACLAAFRQDYWEHWSVATRPYSGIPELLDALAARSMKLAVLSNKPDDLTRRCVAELLPRWRFDVVMGQREGMPRKPDPAVALQVSHSMGIPPSGFLFVGDSPVDMETARAAGMVPVGVSWGFRSHQELVDAGAYVVLEHPADLIGLLDPR